MSQQVKNAGGSERAGAGAGAGAGADSGTGAGTRSSDATCSIERALTVLGERWTCLILRETHAGRTRFAEIRQSLGIAPNLLTTRLATLVEWGVLEKRSYREPGERTRFSYHLTDSGRQALIVLGALQQWGDHYVPRPEGPSAERRARSTGEPLDVSFTTPGGTAVPMSDVTFVPTGR
jgi:DNA-binding HxlR family transcriptional regulator